LEVRLQRFPPKAPPISAVAFTLCCRLPDRLQSPADVPLSLAQALPKAGNLVTFEMIVLAVTKRRFTVGLTN
jgi:hypothetical protein